MTFWTPVSSGVIVYGALFRGQYGMINLLNRVILNLVGHIETDRGTDEAFSLVSHQNIHTNAFMMNSECFLIPDINIKEFKKTCFYNKKIMKNQAE